MERARSSTPSRDVYMTPQIFSVSPHQDRYDAVSTPKPQSDPLSTPFRPTKPVREVEPEDNESVPAVSIYQQTETPLKVREATPRTPSLPPAQPSLFGEETSADAWVTVFGLLWCCFILMYRIL